MPINESERTKKRTPTKGMNPKIAFDVSQMSSEVLRVREIITA